MIEINVGRECPYLKKLKRGWGYFQLAFSPNETTRDTCTCFVGEGQVTAEVTGDRMFQIVGPVEVRCTGCEHLIGGFRVTLNKRIQ